MKKIINEYELNSKVGRSWTLDSTTNDDSAFPENFIMGMTNQKTDFNTD